MEAGTTVKVSMPCMAEALGLRREMENLKQQVSTTVLSCELWGCPLCHSQASESVPTMKYYHSSNEGPPGGHCVTWNKADRCRTVLHIHPNMWRLK